MKNIQIIDGSENCVYDIFAAPDDIFDLVFAPETDIAFVEELEKRDDAERVWDALDTIWVNRIRKCDVQGIHGTIFYGLPHKRQYYPTLRDEDAMNPNGSKLRADGRTTL